MAPNSDKNIILAMLIISRRRWRRRERKIWLRSWIQRRMQQGAYQNLVQELALEDKEMYKNHFRMEEATFIEVANQITSKIIKQDTCTRKWISPKERLATTLIFRASRCIHTPFCLLCHVWKASAMIGYCDTISKIFVFHRCTQIFLPLSPATEKKYQTCLISKICRWRQIYLVFDCRTRAIFVADHGDFCRLR